MNLTGEDIKLIEKITALYSVEVAQAGFPFSWASPQFYEEVARRFNAERKTPN